MSSPARNERHECQCEAHRDHPLMEGRIREKAQSKKGKEPDDEGHGGAMNGAEQRCGDADPVGIGLGWSDLRAGFDGEGL